MAVTKAKRSVHLSKEARRNDRRATDRHPDRGGSSAERRNQIRSSTPSTRHLERSKPAERKNQIRRSSARARRKNRLATDRKHIHYPEARGRIVEDIEFFSDPSHNGIHFRFQDQTSLNFEFATSFAMEASFSRWKAGNERILRYRPRIQTEPIF